MRRIGILAAALGLLMFAQPVRADAQSEEKAQKAAESWLAQVDEGKSGESWDEAAAIFKSAVTRDQWAHSLDSVRKPLGRILSRKLKTRHATHTLDGAPDGDYVVFQFDSSFENKKSAVETITPMLEKSGTWRVAGYYIR